MEKLLKPKRNSLLTQHIHISFKNILKCKRNSVQRNTRKTEYISYLDLSDKSVDVEA